MGIKKGLVSIIIVNWNQKDITIDCLNSLKTLKYKNIEVVLVDNGSTDGSVEEISRKFPKVIIVKNRTNLGFAVPNNRAYKFSHGEYVFCLNNDTKVTPNLVSNLLKTLQSDEKVGVVQPMIYIMDFPGTLDLVGTFLTPVGLPYYFGYWKSDKNKMYLKKRNIFWAKGAAMMIKRGVIEKVGLFDDDFVTYFEEYDFCWRVWLAGWNVVYDPDAIVYHKVGLTSRNLPKAFSIHLTFRNRIETLIKNLSSTNLTWILPTHFLVVIFFSFYYIFKDIKVTLAIWQALGESVARLDKTLMKRNYVQSKIRKLSDRIVLKNNLIWVPVSYYKYLMTKAWLYQDRDI